MLTKAAIILNSYQVCEKADFRSPTLLDMKYKDEALPPPLFFPLFLGRGTGTVPRGVLSEIGDVHLPHIDRGKHLCACRSCSVLSFFPC